MKLELYLNHRIGIALPAELAAKQDKPEIWPSMTVKLETTAEEVNRLPKEFHQVLARLLNFSVQFMQ